MELRGGKVFWDQGDRRIGESVSEKLMMFPILLEHVFDIPEMAHGKPPLGMSAQQLVGILKRFSVAPGNVLLNKLRSRPQSEELSSGEMVILKILFKCKETSKDG